MLRPVGKTPTKLIATFLTLTTVAATGFLAVSTDGPPADAASTATPTAKPRAKPVKPKVADVRMADAAKGRPSVLAARSSAQFALLGITWQNRSSAEVQAQVRVRTENKWTAWQTLMVDSDHAPDSAERPGRGGTEPLWVGAADGVQAKVSSLDGAAVKDLKVALIDPQTSAADASMQSVAATTAAVAAKPAPYARPPIYNRASWGADESLRSYNPDCAVPGYGSTIRGAFVHHTAGTNSYTSAQSAGLIRAIYAYHVRSRGWCDIGYNFLIDRYGRIFEGRFGGILNPVVGAHTEGHNTDTFGVSLMGTFTTAEPTAAMMEATAKVIAWKLDGYYRNPNGRMVLNGTTYNLIAGHSDTKATECPGAKVYAKLPALRSRVWTLMGKAVSTEIYDYANKLGGFAKIGQPYLLEHPVADNGRGTWFTDRDIYWSAATGAYSVQGPIRTLHRQLSNANGVLGLPVAEQRTGRVAGSLVQDFRKAGARRVVYWSQPSGAHEVYDQILSRYEAIGAETSNLGLPTSGPKGTRVLYSRYNVFEHGRMYYSPGTGTHPILGAISDRYIKADAYPVLGMPTTDQYAVTAGLAQDFQHGTITWNSTSGETTLTVK